MFTGGSLADVIQEHERTGEYFTEAELKQLLLQIAQGLHFIHSQGLVHLDIKPGKCIAHIQEYLLLIAVCIVVVYLCILPTFSISQVFCTFHEFSY